MKTFFALVNIPKEQQKSDGVERQVRVGGQPVTMTQPSYETEAAVTAAIASGTFKGNSLDAYRLAREWQRQLQRAQAFTLRVKPRKNSPNHKYNHTVQFSIA